MHKLCWLVIATLWQVLSVLRMVPSEVTLVRVYVRFA